jgi:hypothetical protein
MSSLYISGATAKPPTGGPLTVTTHVFAAQKIEGFRFGVNAGSVARAKSVAGLPERQGSHRTRRKLVLSQGAPAATGEQTGQNETHKGPCAVLTSTPKGGITAIFFSAEQSAIYWRCWAHYLILLTWSCAC